jgi:very-short-patch-repair endonuclease
VIESCRKRRCIAESSRYADRGWQVALTKAGNRLVRVDFFFPDTDVVVEVLGYRWHRSAASLTRDTERSNALLARGLRPYQFTYGTIVERPADVVIQVRQALTS